MNKTKQNLLGSYLVREKWLLVLITVTGILYNLGIIAGPYFEGQLAQTLSDILNGLRTKEDMFRLALVYSGRTRGQAPVRPQIRKQPEPPYEGYPLRQPDP